MFTLNSADGLETFNSVEEVDALLFRTAAQDYTDTVMMWTRDDSETELVMMNGNDREIWRKV